MQKLDKLKQDMYKTYSRMENPKHKEKLQVIINRIESEETRMFRKDAFGV
jgi:chemotaxis methyl-accepting protein methylase